MGEGASLRALGATFLAAGLSALGAWGLVAQSSCALSNCDGDLFVLDGQSIANHRQPPPNASMIDANTWQSSPIDGPWIIYPGQRTYVFNINLGSTVDRKPVDLIAYISPVKLDDRDTINKDFSDIPNSTQFGTASGNLAEFSNITFFPDHSFNVSVHNDTCADFLLRLVVRVAPSLGGSIDSGSPEVDGGTDAPTDAPSDTIGSTIGDAALDAADSGPIDASSQ